MNIGIDRVTDGDVLTAQYEDCCCIFTTLKGPSYYAGYHPVSGNRMFGYKIQDGKTVIFTRGTDRTTTWLHSLKGSEIAFEGADQLWRSVQHNLVEYVKSNGGKLGPVPTQEIIHRPNWSEVKKALTSNYPVTKIPCN